VEFKWFLLGCKLEEVDEPFLDITMVNIQAFALANKLEFEVAT
jgi:hypothetical protein